MAETWVDKNGPRATPWHFEKRLKLERWIVAIFVDAIGDDGLALIAILVLYLQTVALPDCLS